jgi:hypothetical protein
MLDFFALRPSSVFADVLFLGALFANWLSQFVLDERGAVLVLLVPGDCSLSPLQIPYTVHSW